MATKKATVIAQAAVLPGAGPASTAALLAAEALSTRAFVLAGMAARLERNLALQKTYKQQVQRSLQQPD